jgi:hypothetical protein
MLAVPYLSTVESAMSDAKPVFEVHPAIVPSKAACLLDYLPFHSAAQVSVTAMAWRARHGISRAK